MITDKPFVRDVTSGDQLIQEAKNNTTQSEKWATKENKQLCILIDSLLSFIRDEPYFLNVAIWNLAYSNYYNNTSFVKHKSLK